MTDWFNDWLITWLIEYEFMYCFSRRYFKVQKSAKTHVFYRFWCVFRHNGVLFLDIKSLKSGPYPLIFWYFDLQMCFASQRRAIFRDWNYKNQSRTEVFCAFWLVNVFCATVAWHFCRSQLEKHSGNVVVCAFWLANVLYSGVPFLQITIEKWLREYGDLCILTCKCAAQRCAIFADRNLKNDSENVVICAFWFANVLYSGVPFLQIAIWKMAPRMWWFVHFDLQICFTAVCHFCRSQLEKNGSENVVLCTFWFANVLTAVCHFCRSQFEKWLRECGGLCILTCKCASQRCTIFADRNLKNGSENVAICAFWLANMLYSGVPFLQIATWKMAPRMWWFVHFDVQICFTAVCYFCRSQLEKWLRECGGLCILTCKCASQRCAIFADRNLKNGSENVVVCAFWLANVLHSGVRFLQIATSKMAPRMWWFVHFDV